MPGSRVSGRFIVVCGTAVSLLFVVIGFRWPIWHVSMASPDPTQAFLDGLVGVSLVLTGSCLLTASRQRSNGLLIVVAGSLGLLTSIQWQFDPAVFVQWVVVPLPIGIFAVAMLRYPDARLDHPADRRLAAFLLLWLVSGRLVTALLWDPTWSGSFGTAWPTALHNPRAYTAAAWTYHAGCAVLALALLVAVARRMARSTGLMRLRTWPKAVLAPTAAFAFCLQSVSWLAPLSGGLARRVSTASDLALLTTPLVFAIIALQHRLESTRVSDVVVGIENAAAPVQVRDALRSAVAEPQLELALRQQTTGEWVDALGRNVDLGELGKSHLLVPLDDSEGHPLAVVVTNARLAAHRDVLDPALIAVRLSLENARLETMALARLEDVRQSRRRMVLAGVEERRKVERDLHDGAQQRLLAVSASLSRARARASDPASLAVLDAARDDLRAALQDLRELAAGLHPALLSQSGLAAALGSVTERLPLGIHTEVEARRWPADIEMAAYMVICECLTNVVKHSGAGSATVTASQRGNRLLLTVDDDGTGGATPAAGRGLAGLSDRVAALGGTFRIDSKPGRGTRVEAALPCA